MTTETRTTISDPRLPRGVVCLHDSKAQIDDQTLEETLELTMENGYLLADVNDDEYLGTEYELLKIEVDG